MAPEGHEVVFSNGAPTESLYIGSQALKTLTPEAREEIFALFPELSEVNHMASVNKNRVDRLGHIG